MHRRALAIILLSISLPFAQTQDTLIRVGACATPGITWGVYVRDSIAYIADRSYVTAIDVSIPANPWVVCSLTGWPVAAEGIYVQDTVAYCNLTGLGTSFTTISVAEHDSLYLLGSCHLMSGGVWDPTGVVLQDTIVYLATGNGGVMQINVSDPSSPDTIKAYDTPRLAMDLAIKDTLVYVADVSSLQIINFANPLDPYFVGSVPMPNTCCGIFVVDSFVYAVCASTNGYNGSLQVVDVSNPESPHIVASLNSLNGDPLDIWISGNYAYVAAADHWSPPRGKEKQVGGLRPEWTFGRNADVEGGLSVIDISNPLDPALRASYDTPGDPRGVFAVDTTVFVADYDSLQILRHSATGIEETATDSYVGDTRLRIQPNPFANLTVIYYQLLVPDRVGVYIFDITGRLVKTIVEEHQEAGMYAIPWDGRDESNREIASGIYLCSLTTQSGRTVQKLIIVQ